ncbi:MAG: eukaryotic-like serine/threonine-protein kinase [Solirubrobacteraceae bacterium]|nr:eukaryotic-like serine/threonine-protein kinase [Solirubrobacteraceae bacterium]
MARAPTAPAPAFTATASAETRVVLGRYRLRSRLGAGAFGTVWLAHDERLAREVAVKEIPLAGSKTGEPARAAREAVAAARLSHPGIVMLYEAGADDERAYIVSELVRGATLEQLMRNGELSDRDVLRIGVVLCDALAHAHAHGVIHRDVKPSNVIVPDEPDRGAGVAKLTDFGVARVAGDEALTRTGDVIGTLAYMAPEQAEGRRVTGAADLYALALVLYEALTGCNPVRAPGAAATARRVGQPIAPLLRRRRDLPPDLGEAVDRALRADAGQRGTPAELADSLAEALPHVSDEGGTIAPGPFEGARSPGRGRALAARLAPAIGAGTLAALLAAGLTGPWAVSPLAAGALVALAVCLLPRAGWLVAAACAVVLAAVDGRAGGALLIGIAVAGPPVLLRRTPAAWSAPALGAALGAIGLAGAFPALAGSARTALQRAGLGALGALWACLLELASSSTAVFGRPPSAPSWQAVDATLQGAWRGLVALGGTAAPALLVIWAVAAAMLPVLVRGRSLAWDVALATTWAAGLASATHALGRALPGPPRHPTSSALVLGAVAAGVLAVAAARDRRPGHEEFRSMAGPFEEHP